MMISRQIWVLALIAWAMLSGIFTIWMVNNQIEDLKSDLITKAQSLHRIVSQRADQHDAHLTGLSALASANDEPLINMLERLTETIGRFYPTITFVDLVKLDQQNPTQVFTTRGTPTDNNTIRKINSAASASKGALIIVPTSTGYLLVKRSPNSDQARYGLALSIDAAKLLENNQQFSVDTSISLKTAEGAQIFQSIGEVVKGVYPLTLSFSQILGSKSQPLILDVRKTVTLTGIIPWRIVVPFIVFFGVALFGMKAYLDQRLQAKKAEQRALLGEHEARIAQASRINGLGEMASGIAHELTQPLTAILSQSQAGKRIVNLNPNDIETLTSVFGAINQQAKRAGDILARLRKWSINNSDGLELVDLNQVVLGICELVRADLKEKGIRVELALSPAAPVIYGDAVQIEQVLFNLVKNSADALENVSDGMLQISTFLDDEFAALEVSDNGAGISANIISNIKQPFFTTKSNGMGLGLSLCESIVERFNGTLDISNQPDGGVVASVKFHFKSEL